MLRDENKIIKKCLKNNAQAQRALYDMHKVKWFMICLRYAHNKGEAEDMLQEGLISVFKNLRQFDPAKAKFSFWSNKIMVNASLQYLRKWKKLNYTQDVEDHHDLVSVEENIIDKIGVKELTEMIQTLPAGYRTVFNLYVIEGYKHKEIADLLKISENTSKTQLLKAKKMLRSQLEKVLQY